MVWEQLAIFLNNNYSLVLSELFFLSIPALDSPETLTQHSAWHIAQGWGPSAVKFIVASQMTVLRHHLQPQPKPNDMTQ